MPDTPLAFVLAAPHSGAGKTTACLALAVALRRQGLVVHGCKCGPDYIDPTFLSQACDFPCANLDTWLMGEDGVHDVFARQAQGADIVLVEGVMGLLDGKEASSLAGSTLDVARVLGLPVLLVVQARGLARSIAPLADGFQRACTAAGVRLAGVITTCTGSEKHRELLSSSLALYNLPPLLLNLPRNQNVVLPSRQLGLVPAEEIASMEKILRGLGDMLPDTEVRALADCLRRTGAGRVHLTAQSDIAAPPAGSRRRGRLAVARDEAFCFYYDENFRLLENMGWKLVFFSPLRDAGMPAADALYLGGGYPEIFARELAANTRMRAQIHAAAMAGLPVYAECGGCMYLTRELETPDKKRFPMVGLVDATARMDTKLRSLGYREATFLSPLPFGLDDFSRYGRVLRGHEFHWSVMEHGTKAKPLYTVMDKQGKTIPCGIITGPGDNIQASYLHAYFPSLAFLNGKKTAAPVAANIGTGRQNITTGRGRIILLTGPSSAGKTSLASALARELKKRGVSHVLVSLDALLTAFCRDGRACFTLEEAEVLGLWSAHTYHSLLREVAGHNQLIICDHVLCGHSDWIEDAERTLGGICLLPVELSCDEATLVSRENRRTDRPAATAHALAQAQSQKKTPLALSGTISMSTQEEEPWQLCRKLVRLLTERHILPA